MEKLKDKYSNYIDGQSKKTEDYYDLKNPYDLSVIAPVSLSSKADMDKAIKIAHKAFFITKEQPAYERSAVLFQTAKLIEERAEEFAKLIALEACKPIKAARIEVNRTVQTFKFASEEAKRMNGETIPMDAAIGGEGKIAFTLREPIGVVAAITPFNFPLNLVAHKVAPAIAVGNTIVLKPAEQTPLSSLKLAEVMKEAGLIDGALNVVTGDGPSLGDVMSTHPYVKKISFTGSPEVGRLIRKKADFKKITLELGSNTALIIDKESDLDLAVTKAVIGGFVYSGQVCIHTQRIYVHQKVFGEFLGKFTEKVKELKVGSPMDEDTDVSAIINQKSLTRILDWIEEAKNNGATVALGGVQDGQIISPTILTNVNEMEKVVCQEVFGPVVIVNPINSIEEGVNLTNQSKFGLNAGIFTNNIKTALESAKKLEVGQVLINETPTFRVDHMPYGGVKDSGIGKEGLRYAMLEMTEEKLVVIQI